MHVKVKLKLTQRVGVKRVIFLGGFCGQSHGHGYFVVLSAFEVFQGARDPKTMPMPRFL